MTYISKLPGISKAEVQKLRGLNPPINSIEELWQSIGSEDDPQIARLAAQANIGQDRLINLLAGQKLHEGQSGFARLRERLRPYIIDIAVAVLALLALGGLVGRALLIVLSPVDQVVVRDDEALSAGQIIGSDDVTVKSTPWEAGSIRDKNDVLGHYSLEAVPAGEKLSEDHVSKSGVSSAELGARQLLTVPVKAAALSSKVRPTSRVSVVFSPREPDGSNSALIKDEVIVWGIKTNGDTASVILAFKQEDLEDVRSVVGASEVFIMHPAPSLQ